MEGSKLNSLGLMKSDNEELGVEYGRLEAPYIILTLRLPLLFEPIRSLEDAFNHVGQRLEASIT
jgi:hypothetical protein